MNFKDVRSIIIPEGSVKKITSSSNTLLWEKPYIYGVSWAKTSTTSLTRTDDASGFSSPTIATGTGSGSSPFDSCYPWCDIVKVADGNNTLVKIPKFWYKWTDTTSALTLQIATRPLNGYYVCPMCADRGDGKGERDYAYIGRYRCVTSTYYSATGILPQCAITRATARSKIAALGTGYYQQDFAAFWTIRMLFLVEFATWDGVSAIPKPSSPSSSSYIQTGRTDSMIYHTGTSSDGMGMQYRYIEDPWVTCLEWCDGIYFSGSNIYCINNPAKFSDTANGTSIGTKTTSGGFISGWRVPTVSGFEYALWPSAASGSASTYIPDYYYPANGTVMYIGGSRSLLSNHGPFFMYCDFTASDTSSFIGTRLMKLP